MPEKSVFTPYPIGVVHGRFQPLHLGHMEYLLAGKRRCDFLVVGISNPDPYVTQTHPASPHRALPASNPFTYYERSLMVRDSLVEAGLAYEDFTTVPFPITSGDHPLLQSAGRNLFHDSLR